MSDACGHSHADTGLEGVGLDGALAAAEARCATAGERLTPPRRRVLELLLKAGQPAKAYDLIAAYGASGQAAKPPTVYRALEFLDGHGLVHRIDSLKAYVACVAHHHAAAAAFFVCDRCGRAEETELPEAEERLRAAAERRGFAVRTVTQEVHGVCGACAMAPS